jgi:hypothetical protein
MLRKSILLIAVSSVAIFLQVEPAQAVKWSRGNPGIYGNIHGVTYRSIQWERDHGNRQSLFGGGRSRSFRRR